MSIFSCGASSESSDNSSVGEIAFSGPSQGSELSCMPFLVQSISGEFEESPVTEDTVVSLEADEGSAETAGKFFSDKLCQNSLQSGSISEVTIAEGDYQAEFYYLPEIKGQHEIKGDAIGFVSGNVEIEISLSLIGQWQDYYCKYSEDDGIALNKVDVEFFENGSVELSFGIYSDENCSGNPTEHNFAGTFAIGEVVGDPVEWETSPGAVIDSRLFTRAIDLFDGDDENRTLFGLYFGDGTDLFLHRDTLTNDSEAARPSNLESNVISLTKVQ